MLRRAALHRSVYPVGTNSGYLRLLLNPSSPGSIASLDIFNSFAEHFSKGVAAATPASREQHVTACDLLADIASTLRLPAGSGSDELHVALSGESLFRATADPSGKLQLAPSEVGFCLASGKAGSAFVSVLAQLPGDRFAVVNVPAGQIALEPTAASSSPSMLRRAALKSTFSFAENSVTLLPDWASANALATGVRAACTATKVRMLDALKVTAALHASHFARYGTHLCNDQLHQRRLALLDSSSYGLRAFSFLNSANRQEADVVAADVLASSLLRSGCSEAALVLGLTGAKLRGNVQHATNAAVSVDYSAAAAIVNTNAPSLLVQTDFGLDALAANAIGEELTEIRRSPKRSRYQGHKGSGSSPFSLFKKQAVTTTRLNNVHMNLTPAAAQVEQGVDELLAVAAGRKDKEPVTAIDTMVTILLASEVLCSAAALFRASAALMTLEDETAAQQEATLANVFCDLSRMRRGELLRNYQTMQQRQLKTAAYVEYDELSTNCIELGTAAAPAAASAKAAKK